MDRQRTLTKAEKTAISLWTACPMTFHAGQGQFIVISRFTPCKKPVYTLSMCNALDRILERGHDQLSPGDFWVYVELEGLRRTVQRSCLLNQKEYDAIREKERASLGSLRAKCKRNVDQGGQDTGVDLPPVAESDGGDGGSGQDA